MNIRGVWGKVWGKVIGDDPHEPDWQTVVQEWADREAEKIAHEDGDHR